MHFRDVVIIGGGQAGLAMSRSLAVRGIDHVVLERGRIGERWRSERWDSLRLLTPASHSALPCLHHTGAQPDDFLSARDFSRYLDHYARAFAAPVVTHADVRSVDATSEGYRVASTAGIWRARAVVIATGACDTPFRPHASRQLPGSILQVSPTDYRNPNQLPAGGVLIVGASSTGVQLADEIHRSGRPVTLAVGDHTRMPRCYRGRDIYAWMDYAGILDDLASERRDLDAARRQPSLQLVGLPGHRDLDLEILRRQGVRIVGRLGDIDGGKIAFLGDLRASTARSHARMLRALARIDAAILQAKLAACDADPAVRAPVLLDSDPVMLDPVSNGVRSVIWATGFRRHYPWLNVPVLDGRGEIAHQGGVTAAPGLFILGLTFLRRRRSSFIDGCGRDAEELAEVVRAQLSAPRLMAA